MLEEATAITLSPPILSSINIARANSANSSTTPSSVLIARSARAYLVTLPAHYKSVFTSNPTTWVLLIWQTAMIILFATCSTFPPSYSPGGVPSSSKPARYSMWMDTHTS